MAPRDLGPTVLITAFSLVGVSTVIVAVRFYCRVFLMRAVKSYDYLMLLALLLTWGIATTNYYQVKFGTGKHMADQDQSLGLLGLEGTLKSWYTYQMIYLADLCAVKFSILMFYRVISAQRAYRIAVYIVMGIVAAFTVAMIFVNAFECPKPSDAWSVEILFQGKGSCLDLHPVYYSQAAFNILSDIVILLLPMPVLYTLQMRRNKRLALIAIFSCGSVAVVASALRIWALTMWSDPTADIPYQGANILIWSQIEINAAIISASIPSLKPLFKHTFGTTAGTGAKQYQYPYSGRSYGNFSTAHSKRLHSNAEIGLESSASIMVTPSRPYDQNVELKGMRNGGSKGAMVSEKYSHDSDEDAILSHSKHASDPNSYNSDDGPPTSGGNGNNMHIMRSVTIETSVRNKADQHGNGGSPRSNNNHGRGDPYGYPREREQGGRGYGGSYV